MTLIRRYRTYALPSPTHDNLLEAARANSPATRSTASTRSFCFYIDAARDLGSGDLRMLDWLLAETFEPQNYGDTSCLDGRGGTVLEVGPRMTFTTAWSTNAVSICRACGIDAVRRIERSRRYLLRTSKQLSDGERTACAAGLHDRMTECLYPHPLADFASGISPETVTTVPVMRDGRAALERINRDLGLAFDDWDLDFYTALFRDRIGRDPTNVECFDIAQSNSEHSRHWFFKGRLVIDGVEAPEPPLFDWSAGPYEANPNNSVIAFHDNSSAIRGGPVATIVPITRATTEAEASAAPYQPRELDLDIILTAETHNFPSGVAPFPGAETGTGGRIRDVHATGRAGDYTAGTAAYCVGNLQIPDDPQPWEDPSFTYPDNLASPLEIEIEASNGASDYGNKFGEPVITGFTRSAGLRLPGGERREWIKPIMFSGGVGQIDARHTAKEGPEPEMWVVKIGGPAYRIGMGGGAASSMVQGENAADLDFNAVQRGDAEMEQKVNRVIRACSELGPGNPIVSIHDQGAGGNCNVLKEIVEPAGARLEIREIPVGDDSLSVLEIWGAEYQENDALLLRPEHEDLFRVLCEREKVPVGLCRPGHRRRSHRGPRRDDDSTPVDLVLDTCSATCRRRPSNSSVSAPELRAAGAAARSRRSPRPSTGCCGCCRWARSASSPPRWTAPSPVWWPASSAPGPLQLTVADVAVIAQSHFGTTGTATAIGEQPLKGLVDPAAMARMAVGEALTNLVWARITALEDTRCSANWMWAAKLPGEGADLYDAAVAMSDLMVDLGMAVDGGKDSLSMAARAPGRRWRGTVKAPGALVISAYVDLSRHHEGGHPGSRTARQRTVGFCRPLGRRDPSRRLGTGTGLLSDRQRHPGCRGCRSVGARIRGGSGPDCRWARDRRPRPLRRRSGHDPAGDGLRRQLRPRGRSSDRAGDDPIAVLFNEELGLVMEVDEARRRGRGRLFRSSRADLPCAVIGRTLAEPEIRVAVGGRQVLAADMRDLRDLWEATSRSGSNAEQADPACVAAERDGLRAASAPPYALTFTPTRRLPHPGHDRQNPGGHAARGRLQRRPRDGRRVLRRRFRALGRGDVRPARRPHHLDRFRGLVAVGGFAYADVLDAAKGWAGSIRFNRDLWAQFEAFLDRPDTFSLGVCNGCQLLALLGWVPWRGIETSDQPRFVRNASGRFESRFATVTIQPSPAVMLRGMEGSILGVWSAHGEGRALFPNAAVFESSESRASRTDPLCRRRWHGDRVLPSQPQRFAAGHRRSVLARRPPPRHDAAPRTHHEHLELGLDAAGLAPPRGLAVAQNVPERSRMV